MMREQDEVTVAWQRPGPTSRQRLQDLYLGILVAVGSLLSATLANSAGSLPLGKPPPWPEQLAWSVGVTLPLIWRRVWPEASLLVVAAGFIGAQVRGNPDSLASSSALFIAIYTLGAWGRHRRLGVWLRIGVIVSMFIFIAVNVWMSIPDIPADAFPDAAGPLPPLIAAVIYNVLFNLLFFLFAYFYGDTAWTSARRQHDLEVQAEELRRSQAERAERAVIGERVRIARELHDVVAHHVSVMGVQAAACRRVFDKDPTQARTALSAVEETARTAIDELRRMLGVLRNAGGTEEPTSPVSGQATPGRYGLDQVESLVRSVREAGLTVRYESFGTPKRIPDSVSLAAYRVVQEALTNTIKHARASRVDIRIRHLEWEIEVDVTDDGRGVAAGGTPARMTGGLGLIGMHERVTAHDGVLEVGPRTAGGFRVRARLPLTVGAERSEVAA